MSTNIHKIHPIEEAKLDEAIKPIVLLLQQHGVETFESCQGGIGHCFPDPTVRFYGDKYEGLRVAHICLQNALPIQQIRRAFDVYDDELHQPFWEVTFKPGYTVGSIELDTETASYRSGEPGTVLA